MRNENERGGGVGGGVRNILMEDGKGKWRATGVIWKHFHPFIDERESKDTIMKRLTYHVSNGYNTCIFRTISFFLFPFAIFIL